MPSTAMPPPDNSLPRSYVATPGEAESISRLDWFAAYWSWSSVLLVRLSPTTQREDLLSSILVVAPNQEGLAVLHDIDAEIDAVWLVDMPTGADSLPSTESVRKIGPWTSKAGNKSYQTALHCASGAVFAVGDACLVRVEETDLSWTSGGKYRQHPADALERSRAL